MPESAIAVVEWLSADDAAKRLGISKRRVLEYAQAGALQRRKIRDVATNQMAVQVHAGDVERLRDERENPKPRTIADPDGVRGGALSRISAHHANGKGRLMAEWAEAIAQRELPPSELRHKLFLTEDEAMRYTGLGRGMLRASITDGARRGPRGAVVYRRTDLEKL